MFSATYVVTCVEGISDDAKKSLLEELDAAGAAIGDCHVAAETVYQQDAQRGDILLEIGFANQDAYEAAKSTDDWQALQDTLADTSRVALCDWAAYGKGAENFTDTTEARCHRVLLMQVREGADPAMLEEAYEASSHMREYVRGFLNSKIAATVESGGHANWDYVFECDYADPMIYFGPYMLHPVHIGYIDRYFEPACEQWVFSPDLYTSVIEVDGPFLANFPDGEQA